jgi:hypothetical protein
MKTGNLLTVKVNMTLASFDQTAQRVVQGGFTRTIASQKSDQLPLAHLQRNTPEDIDLAIATLKRLDLKQWTHH